MSCENLGCKVFLELFDWHARRLPAANSLPIMIARPRVQRAEQMSIALRQVQIQFPCLESLPMSHGPN